MMRGCCLGDGNLYAFVPGPENAGRGSAVPGDEFLKALNARLEVALEYLGDGQTEDAARILRSLSRILPPPERRHLEAARGTHLHDHTRT